MHLIDDNVLDGDMASHWQKRSLAEDEKAGDAEIDSEDDLDEEDDEDGDTEE